MTKSIENEEYYKILDVITKQKNVEQFKQYKSPYNFNEKKILDGLDKISNKINNYKTTNVGFLNLSLLEIFSNISKTLSDIIYELPLLIEEEEDNVHYEKWWGKYITKLKGILVILTKKDRLIYLGILLIFLSIVVYFIEISS